MVEPKTGTFRIKLNSTNVEISKCFMINDRQGYLLPRING